MRTIHKILFGALLMTLPFSTGSAANYTTDVNGWGYTEIREFTLKPYIVPIGTALLMITIAYLVEECRAINSH